MMRFSLFFLSLIFLFSCTEKEELSEVKIQRFDKELMSSQSKEQLVDLLSKNPYYTKSLYRAFPNDTAFQSHLYYIISHPETRKLYKETLESFGDLKTIENDFNKGFNSIKENFKEFSPPNIVTTFTGLENDIFVSDSLIIISFEAFLGPKATFRPQQPDYILTRFDKPFIVPTVLNLLSKRYNKIKETDNSLLADMIFFGKSLEFTKEMLAPISDSLIIGYSSTDLKKAWFSQDKIWEYFVAKKLLYEQNPGTKRKYLDERPYVNEISDECPGRIGQWLGWRIVQKYREENPNISIEELMAIDDPQVILSGSKYRGEIEKYGRE